MSRLDDRLTNELERIARPADPSRAFELVDRRRARRHVLRRVQAMTLAVVVIAGSVGGFVYLSKAFGPAKTPGSETPVHNGVLVVSELDDFGLGDLYSLNPATGETRQLTNHPIDESDAAVSPDGRYVAYTQIDKYSRTSIRVIAIDGGAVTTLTDPAWGAVDPSWAPDGTKIAFSASIEGDPEGIYWMNLDDGGIVPMTDASVVSATDPSWSPDGRKVVFSAHAPGDTPELLNLDLYVFDLVDATTTRLTDTPDRDEVQPAWSPGGDSIAYVEETGDASTPLDGGIRLIAPNGILQATLTAGGVLDQHPTWSPDGKLIAFDRSIEGTGVYTVDPSDRALVEIGPGVSPSWQPVGDDLPAVTIPTPSWGERSAVDIGLGFPVCDVRSVSADFDGDGTIDSASVVTKMSDAPDCPAPGTSTEVLVVDLDGDGMADASGGPLACISGCDPFATPDVDGDGLAEIAIVVDRPADGTKRIQLWDLTTPPGGELAVIPFVDANGDPATFTWGTVTNWGGSGPEVFGVSCTSRTSPPLVTEWQAIPTGPDSWHISEHAYNVVGTELRSAFEDSYDVPGEETVFPDGGGDTICGSPVNVSG